MERYIKLYNNVIDQSVCDAMITLFNSQDSVQRSNPTVSYTHLTLPTN